MLRCFSLFVARCSFFFLWFIVACLFVVWFCWLLWCSLSFIVRCVLFVVGGVLWLLLVVGCVSVRVVRCLLFFGGFIDCGSLNVASCLFLFVCCLLIVVCWCRNVFRVCFWLFVVVACWLRVLFAVCCSLFVVC